MLTDRFHPGYLGLIAVAIVVAVAAGCAEGEKPEVKKAMEEKEILELCRVYKELRKKQGHFSGGEWDDDLDSYWGKLHITLGELGTALGHPPYTRADIVRYMGEPDSVRRQDEEEHLIYFWRGWHDYLYFVCRNGAVQECRWYFAYE